MSLKKLGVALLAVFVMSAIAANSAFATNEFSETGGQWYTGASPGTKLPVGTTKDFKLMIGGSFSWHFSLGAFNIPTLILSASVTGNKCSLVNPATIKATTDCESWTFSTVTVAEPANCTVVGGSITTKKTTAILGMNKAKTVATLKIQPQEGATFATLELAGEKCSVAGLYKVTGTVFAQAANATGVVAKTQKFSTSAAIQESAGEANSLRIGEHAATMTGSIEGTLEGEAEWAGKES